VRAALLLAVLVVASTSAAGCGGASTASPEAVVRAWSDAIDRNDNAAAGRLFAPGARVVQIDTQTLHTPAEAREWNDELPCGGTIVSLTQDGADVTVVFKLGDRPAHVCDGPGSEASAIFRVEGGKIVLWHQTALPPTPDQHTV
jgi:limonene-1,2-epoxide hydrolase